MFVETKKAQSNISWMIDLGFEFKFTDSGALFMMPGTLKKKSQGGPCYILTAWN